MNKEESPIECEYFFPIEEEAAVIDFKAEIEGRVLTSKVKEREEAKKDYDEAIEQGKTGFLMEQTRPDILEISVGNLSPGAGCTISLTYIYEAALEVAKTRLTIPTTISPKYIPFHDTSPEAKRIAAIKYDFNTPAPLSFDLEVLMKSRIENVSSPSHKVVSEGGAERNEAGFYASHTTFKATTADMDRDIVVLVQCEDPNKSVIFVEEGEESKVMMVSLVPKLVLKAQPKLDVVFLIDCSGSMNGSSIRLAREAINILLHSLPSTVLFNIVCFGSRYTKLFPHSLPYSDKTLGEAKEAMSKLDANLGGTEILAPLNHLLEEKTEAPRRIFVLTDGSVSNSQECIRVTRQNNTNNRVFTLGIGAGADRHLVKGLARAGLGTFEFTIEGEIMAPKILKQLKNCVQPSLNNVHVNWGSEVGPDNSCQAPETFPPIYSGHRIQIFRLFDKDFVLPTKVGIHANVGSTETSYDEDVQVETATMKGNLLHKMFARKLILGLEENFGKKDEQEVKSLVTELSLKYQLMSKHTSFIAVDSKATESDKVMVKRQVATQVPHGFGGGYSNRPMMFGGAPGGGIARSMRCAAPPPMMAFCAMPQKAMAQPMTFGFSAASQPAMECDSMDMSQAMAQPTMAFGGAMQQQAMVRTSVDSSSNSFMGFGGKKKKEKRSPLKNYTNREDEEEDDDSGEQMSAPKKTDMEIVMMVISLQSAAGFFTKNAEILKALSLDHLELEKARGSFDEQLFYSWLMVLVLETRFPELEDCWEMVVEKGKQWIEEIGRAHV